MVLGKGVAFVREDRWRAGLVRLAFSGAALVVALGCKPQVVDDWHAKLRVGQTSELVLESPRARDPSRPDEFPPARLWVAVDGPVEPGKPVTLARAWRVHYAEKTDRYRYLSEEVTGSVILVHREGVPPHLSIEVQVYPVLDTEGVGKRRLDGYLPVEIEYAEPVPREGAVSSGAQHRAAPPPPDWFGAPAPTGEGGPAFARPPELEPQPGMPPPPGYRHVESKSYTMSFVGAALFVGAYGTTVALASVDGFDGRQGWLAVPVAGPYLAYWPEKGGPDGDGGARGSSGILPFLIAAPQVAGLGLVFSNLLEGPSQRWIRDDLTLDDVSLTLTPLPHASGIRVAGTARW